MIQNCNENTVMVHMDFSEAWKCKYYSEVQSCHFGQNLPQLNLHTGMWYTKEGKRGFCTVSESKRQDSSAIWTHMEPVIKEIRSMCPNVDTIHFWSDGPSKQYKTKKKFWLSSSIPLTLGFQREQLGNFYPTSHGKGAPDGIGGTVKRTPDSLILCGHDLVNGRMFHEMVGKSLENIQLFYITQDKMQTYDSLISQKINAVPGTRKVH